MGPTPSPTRIPRHADRFGWPLPPLAGAQDPPPPAPTAPAPAPTPAPPAPEPPAASAPPAPSLQLQPPAIPSDQADWFPRSAMESVRRESAGYREKHSQSQAQLDAANKLIADQRKQIAAHQAGIPNLASRLQGSTPDELAADAARLAQEMNGATPPAPTPDPAAPTVPQIPTPPPTPEAPVPPNDPAQPPAAAPAPLPVPPRGPSAQPTDTVISAPEARRLAKEDPTRFNELFDAGKIPGEALRPQ